MDMYDTIEKLHNSTIQHGLHNNRIYLLKLHDGDAPDIIQVMDKLAQEKGYGKILAKVPVGNSFIFEQSGYSREAFVPGFFKGINDLVFMTKYFSRERRLERQSNGIREILAAAQKKRPNVTSQDFEKKPGIFLCSPSDAREMSAVYQQVFRTYPFPIYDPDYLIDSMKQHIHYYCVREGNRIVSLASSEIDADSLSAEMMDFATLPDWRGQRLARQLLERMETEMTRLNMRTAYTIARALSPAMNITFARMGYAYGGTLNNNTNISGHIQSMNVWYKSLQKTIPRA